MADGHFQDVELLRRELAMLVLEWAGKAVKDDPDGPMSTALARAVGEAARGAVTQQHQALADEAADRIAEAIERRDKAEGLLVWRVRPWMLGVIALASVALLAVAFLVGLQAGRMEGALPPATAATAASAPIAPLAPSVQDPAPPAAPRRAQAPAQQQPAPRPERSAHPAASTRQPPRELGRPAPVGDGAAPRSAQPVGAATTPPAAASAPTNP